MMRRFILVTAVFIIAFLNVISHAHAYFDQKETTESTFITIGNWTFEVEDPNDLTSVFIDYFGVADAAALYSDPVFFEIMEVVSGENTGGRNKDYLAFSINGIDLGDYLWQFDGVYNRTNRDSVGFLRIINRIEDEGITRYPLMPAIAETAEDDFFTAYDVKNALTDNQLGFRLENRSILTTESAVPNLESISFYALRGLLNETGENIENRIFEVLISPTGAEGSFISLGTELTQAPTVNQVFDANNPVSQDFPFYTFNLTPQQIDDAPQDGYYIRIIFNGQVQGNGGNATRSRIVIDELSINTND